MPLSDRVAHCKVCDRDGHTPFTCPFLPRSTLKVYKPMSKVGRVGKETAKSVAKWKRQKKPNHQGYFECYICQRWVAYLEAEHTKSKARHPELRNEASLLRPVCDDCNEKKGSKDMEV
jgi:hypothetical protein